MSASIRVCVAVVRDGKILLVPGGRVEHCETLTPATEREFEEETGFKITSGKFLGYAEAIEPQTPYHGLTLAFAGTITGGQLREEPEHNHGDVDKTPRWFSLAELQNIPYHAPEIVQKAFHD